MALSRPAVFVALHTKFLHLFYVALHIFPSFYLARIFGRDASTQVVSAIPLEPATRVFLIYPAFSLPFLPALAGVDLEVIDAFIVVFTELCICKPACRELVVVSFKIMPAKHSKLQHLFRGEFWLKIISKVFALWLAQLVCVALQIVADRDLCHALIIADLWFDLDDIAAKVFGKEAIVRDIQERAVILTQGVFELLNAG